MFGLSWGQISIIVLVGVFVLGPERIPTAVTWVTSNLRKVKTMAAGAQEGLRNEIGPEIEELRRQVADLQSLKEIQGLRELRDLNPKRLLTKNILGEEFSGGIGGFLGLNSPPATSAATTPIDEPVVPAVVDVEAHRLSLTKTFAASTLSPPPDSPTASSSELVTTPELITVGGASGSVDPTTRVSLVAGEWPPFDPDGT